MGVAVAGDAPAESSSIMAVLASAGEVRADTLLISGGPEVGVTMLADTSAGPCGILAVLGLEGEATADIWLVLARESAVAADKRSTSGFKVEPAADTLAMILRPGVEEAADALPFSDVKVEAVELALPVDTVLVSGRTVGLTVEARAVSDMGLRAGDALAIVGTETDAAADAIVAGSDGAAASVSTSEALRGAACGVETPPRGEEAAAARLVLLSALVLTDGSVKLALFSARKDPAGLSLLFAAVRVRGAELSSPLPSAREAAACEAATASRAEGAAPADLALLSATAGLALLFAGLRVRGVARSPLPSAREAAASLSLLSTRVQYSVVLKRSSNDRAKLTAIPPSRNAPLSGICDCPSFPAALP
jgi:hypothetical protein